MGLPHSRPSHTTSRVKIGDRLPKTVQSSTPHDNQIQIHTPTKNSQAGGRPLRGAPLHPPGHDAHLRRALNSNSNSNSNYRQQHARTRTARTRPTKAKKQQQLSTRRTKTETISHARAYGANTQESQTMLTFHEVQLEINRAESKLQRQERAVEQTRKLIAGLKELQQRGEAKK